MKRKFIIPVGFVCLLTALVVFICWQALSFRTMLEHIADTTGDFQLLLEYSEGKDGPTEQIRLDGEKEGLRRMHVMYSDNAVSEVECYADLSRSELLVNGLSAVPVLKDLLPPDTGVFFSLDQIETLAGKPLIDAQVRYYYSEDKIRSLLQKIAVLPCPRFLLPEDLKQDAGTGRGYRIPGTGVGIVLEPQEGDRPGRVSFYLSEEDMHMYGNLLATPDDTVQIQIPEPVSDTVVELLKKGMEYLS